MCITISHTPLWAYCQADHRQLTPLLSITQHNVIHTDFNTDLKKH